VSAWVQARSQQAVSFDVARWLKPGTNLIAVAAFNAHENESGQPDRRFGFAVPRWRDARREHGRTLGKRGHGPDRCGKIRRFPAGAWQWKWVCSVSNRFRCRNRTGHRRMCFRTSERSQLLAQMGCRRTSRPIHTCATFIGVPGTRTFISCQIVRTTGSGHLHFSRDWQSARTVESTHGEIRRVGLRGRLDGRTVYCRCGWSRTGFGVCRVSRASDRSHPRQPDRRGKS